MGFPGTGPEQRKETMDTVIEASHVGFQYAREPIFADVSFRIERGDFMALTGPNGAGKSTLIKLMLGELLPQKGEMKLFGQNVRQFRRWPQIGYLPQNGTAVGANFPATALEIVQASLFSKIGLMRPVRKEHKQKAREALMLTGMADHGKELFSQLSGGQQQRVLLAGMLAGDPAVMILDEPTTGVDARGIKDLMDLLASLNKEKMVTVVMVTHDLKRASAYAGRTFCLEEGSLMELTQGQIRQELVHRHHHSQAEAPEQGEE